jgi:hypothetical protein
LSYEVRVGDHLAQTITEAFGPQRSSSGHPSEWDFWSGPLAAALIAFRDFESLRYDDIPAIRSLHLVDPVFGALVFVGVLVEPAVVELAAFTDDPDYWQMIETDPDD